MKPFQRREVREVSPLPAGQAPACQHVIDHTGREEKEYGPAALPGQMCCERTTSVDYLEGMGGQIFFRPIDRAGCFSGDHGEDARARYMFGNDAWPGNLSAEKERV